MIHHTKGHDTTIWLHHFGLRAAVAIECARGAPTFIQDNIRKNDSSLNPAMSCSTAKI